MKTRPDDEERYDAGECPPLGVIFGSCFVASRTDEENVTLPHFGGEYVRICSRCRPVPGTPRPGRSLGRRVVRHSMLPGVRARRAARTLIGCPRLCHVICRRGRVSAAAESQSRFRSRRDQVCREYCGVRRAAVFRILQYFQTVRWCSCWTSLEKGAYLFLSPISCPSNTKLLNPTPLATCFFPIV